MERTRTASVDKQQKNTENTLKNSVITALINNGETTECGSIGVLFEAIYKGRDCGADVIGFQRISKSSQVCICFAFVVKIMAL